MAEPEPDLGDTLIQVAQRRAIDARLDALEKIDPKWLDIVFGFVDQACHLPPTTIRVLTDAEAAAVLDDCTHGNYGVALVRRLAEWGIALRVDRDEDYAPIKRLADLQTEARLPASPPAGPVQPTAAPEAASVAPEAPAAAEGAIPLEVLEREMINIGQAMDETYRRYNVLAQIVRAAVEAQDKPPEPEGHLMDEAETLSYRYDRQKGLSYERLPEVSRALRDVIAQAMIAFPEQRLGQIITNALRYQPKLDLFYLYDEHLYAALQTYIEEHGA